MKIALLSPLVFCLAFAPPTIPSVGGRIDPTNLISIKDSFAIGEFDKDAQTFISVISDAQTMRDVENEIRAMPKTSTLTPDAVIAMIESHRKINKDHYNGDKGTEKSETYKILLERKRTFLEAKSCIRKNENLTKEIEHLRNKKKPK